MDKFFTKHISVLPLFFCLMLVNISLHAQLQLTFEKVDPSCNSYADGSISVSTTDGTPPYTYQWNTGQFNDTISGLTAGNYLVTVTDFNGTTGSGSVELVDPQVLQTHLDLSDSLLTCSQRLIIATSNPLGGTLS